MKMALTKTSMIFLMLLCGFTYLKAVESYNPNDRTEWPTPNPLAAEILIENFQDWPNTRTFSINPDDCNINNRTLNFNWQNHRFRRYSGETEWFASVYLHNCEIQPFCDTQSGLYNTQGQNTGSGDKMGPSNPGVSVGNITVLDATTINGTDYNQGWIVIGEMKRVKLIQYTHSNFGSRRGFRLEYSYDKGLTWIMLRNERGQASTDSTASTSGQNLWNSPKGIIWEEEVNLSNVMLRFTRSSVNAQMFRIHDLRIFGRALSADMNDSEFETNTGITWNDWILVGNRRVNSGSLKISFVNSVLNLSEQVEWIKVTNLSGQVIRQYGQEQLIDMSDLPSGMYLVQAKDMTGRIVNAKFVR